MFFSLFEDILMKTFLVDSFSSNIPIVFVSPLLNVTETIKVVLYSFSHKFKACEIDPNTIQIVWLR